MRIRAVLLVTALAIGGLAASAEAGSCEIAGVRFVGWPCTAKCVVESGDPFVVCAQ